MLLNVILFLTLQTFSSISCNLGFMYPNMKRNNVPQTCIDPKMPFQCPGSKVCISIQYLCDGQSDDCPNNQDEDERLCLASKNKC